jgi:hypothetical protein
VQFATADFDHIVEECMHEGLTDANLDRLVNALAQPFKVRADEVGIFRVEGPWLTFVYPVKLRNIGTIPLNANGSIAAQTVNTGRPQIINNFTQVRHATLFEAVSLADNYDKASAVIQKMMSVPLAGPSGIIGVLQISRKGATPGKAGADFNFSDLQKLLPKAASFAKLLAKPAAKAAE